MKCLVIFLATLVYVDSHVLTKRQIGTDFTSANCPAGWNPSPCTCRDIPSTDKASVYCNDAKTGDEIKNAFATLQDPKAFETFSMRNTLVSSLPAETFGKASFVSFFMSDNKLESLDDNAFKGSEQTAQNFLMERNSFSTFNFKALSGLTNLRNFELSSDKVNAIPSDAFGEKRNLEVINMNDNQIETIGPNAFAKLPKLRTIDLSRNNISSLPDFTFSTTDSENPISLLLGHNDISTISPNAFKDLKVRTFEAENNQLTSLDETIFSAVLESLNANNGYISTLGNPFNCQDDKVQWILALPANKRSRIIGFMCRDGRALQQLESSN